MKSIIHLIRAFVLIVLALTNFVASPLAQEVSIPDPGLNAAIREALQKSAGPLTEPDMLGLTVLSACCRSISSIQGLEAARNLTVLDLHSNSLTNFVVPGLLTKLRIIDLFQNQLTTFALPTALSNLTIVDVAFNFLTQCSLPNGLNNLDTLFLAGNQLTNFTLPAGLSRLTQLDLSGNELITLDVPADMTNVATLLVFANQLTNLNLPANLNRLSRLNLADNQLSTLSMPVGMTNLAGLFLRRNHLDSLALPADLTKLAFLDLDGNQLTNVTIPGSLTALTDLHLAINRLASFTLPSGLTNLASLDLFENALASFTLPGRLTALTNLDLGVNLLTSFTVPADTTNLTTLLLFFNQLTNVSLAAGMGKLDTVGLSGNKLKALDLPSGLTALAFLNLNNNQLTNITLPPDMQQLIGIFVDGNPLTTFVLSEPLAAANLAGTLSTLTNQGVNVFTYPLAAQLVRPLALIGEFKFAITGPPGTYTVLGSTNLETWSVVRVASNPLGSVNFHDVTANASPQKFYRVLLQTPPANMVFIPPNTFTMGSPDSEVGHQVDEGPQTMVTLTRGFWIGKYEVTQGEYLAVTGENHSDFPGDLNRPVETVSFLAASNYCFLLTAQDQASGQIPPGSHYRLPTEAEWECAARAGTSTRFSYGDDPDLTGLSDFAWFGAHNGNTTHPVGQKLPNAWGLYDMEGNVWEWCQDWYGPYPGGSVIDPQGVADPRGPASNPFGFKVIRGGAWEASEFDCRSASRWSEVAYPFVHDFRLGFRVVLVTEPQ